MAHFTYSLRSGFTGSERRIVRGVDDSRGVCDADNGLSHIRGRLNICSYASRSPFWPARRVRMVTGSWDPSERKTRQKPNLDLLWHLGDCRTFTLGCVALSTDRRRFRRSAAMHKKRLDRSHDRNRTAAQQPSNLIVAGAPARPPQKLPPSCRPLRRPTIDPIQPTTVMPTQVASATVVKPTSGH